MRLSALFNGFYSYSVKETVPFFTTLAVVILIAALIYDYFRRRIAHKIIKSINDAGAHSPSSALTASALDETLGSWARFGKYMLRRQGALRRCVKAVKTDSGASYYIPQSPDAPAVGADAVEASNNAYSSLPASLRGGGERSLRSLIITVILLVIAGELFIRFFPTLYEYIIGNSKNLFS